MLLKKLIPLLCVLLTLCGCSARNITPTINTSVDTKAVYRVGDFYFDCDITWKDNIVTVIPTNTLAAGMIMTCDGKNVTFNRNDMVKAYPKDKTTAYNPATLLYEVFSSLSTIHSKKTDTGFVYTGMTSVGKFTLSLDKKGVYKTLFIPQANIEIEFK